MGLAGKYKLDFLEFTPSSVKKCVTGRGGADKSVVQKMVKAILKINKDFRLIT